MFNLIKTVLSKTETSVTKAFNATDNVLTMAEIWTGLGVIHSRTVEAELLADKAKAEKAKNALDQLETEPTESVIITSTSKSHQF